MISTRDLRLLPGVGRLRVAMQSMAMLDAIIEPVWWLRYYSFIANFSPDGSIWLGSMQNGSGDDLDAIFSPVGCLIRGFAHEYPMSPYANEPPKVFPGILDEVPSEFADCITALDPSWWENVTFCVWRKNSDTEWQHGNIQFPNDDPVPDGSAFLLSIYDGKPETYHSWAESYFDEKTFPLESILHVFEHRPLTDAVVRTLNPARSLDELASEVQQIGYPISVECM